MSLRQPCLLLRSSWQSVNIGDITHTPGALRLLERDFPGARLMLWPSNLGHGARELLLRRFPRLEVVEGGIGADGRPDTPALTAAFAEADVLIHGSSAHLAAREHMAAWHAATGKPFGFFGVTYDPVSGFDGGRREEGGTLAELGAAIAALPAGALRAEARAVLDAADFVFCRDTLSLAYLRQEGVRARRMDFGPDATYGVDLRDDARGDAYRAEHGLATGKFLCVIPRLRYTPYHRIHGRPANAQDERRDAINARTVEADHAGLRELITRWVRTTGEPVLACPEMTYQVELAREQLVEPLPADVRRRVVWRERYWLPDEAAAVYAHATAVVSLECHSPIIAMTNGTPGLYVRQPTDTVKGRMHADLGSGDWLAEVEQVSGEELARRVLAIRKDPAEAAARVRVVMANAARAQARMTAAVREALAGAVAAG